MKKYFRIALKGSHPVIFFDLEVPESQSLPMWWSNVFMAGYVLTDKFCIVYDQIAHVSVVTFEQTQPGYTKPTLVS